MEKAKNVLKVCSKIKDNKWKIFTGILILLTLFRIYLGYNIPLFGMGYQGYDDTLLISYAANIARRKLAWNLWIGNTC